MKNLTAQILNENEYTIVDKDTGSIYVIMTFFEENRQQLTEMDYQDIISLIIKMNRREKEETR